MTSFRRPAVTLNDGASLPLLGFGTWPMAGGQVEDAVRTALECGYRHVDTATMYANEAGVGRGIRAAGVPREEVFVTTKIPPRHFDRGLAVLHESLGELGLDRVDLWLIHWPGGSDAVPGVWRELVKAQEQGLATSIGVSNYSLAQLDALIEATGVTPAANQIEWSPALYDAAVAAGHRERGVVLEGYSPLKSANLEDPTLVEVARAHDATPAQVIIAWHVAHGFVVIPKSARPDRIRANALGVRIKLAPDEVERLDGLGLP